MNRYFLYTLLVILLTSITANASTPSDSDIQKKTYLYSVKDKDSLRLDMYDLPSIKGNKPCLIFVFGGGFVAGTRDQKAQIPFFKELANYGYKVISIDYRLGLKKAGEIAAQKAKIEKETGIKQKKSSPKDFLNTFNGTIEMAVEDLFDATNYVLEHADEWNIDKNMIVACGSSAGAITVLHGEYNISNKTALAKKLPTDFNYAGVISFAGAIFSMQGDLKWRNTPTPILFFHGDSDKNVPYDQLRVKILGIKTKYGFFGSKHIAKQLDKMKSPYYFYSVERAAHEISGSPMSKNTNEIKTFLDKFVKNKEKLIINTEVQQLDKPELKKKFGIKDYLEGNGLGAKKENEKK